MAYGRAVFSCGDARAGRSLAVIALWVLAIGCDPESDEGRGPDAGSATRPKERTVRIGLLRVAERELRREPDGSASYQPAIPLAGVEVCAAERRDAYDLFAPFEPIDPPICATSVPGETMHLDALPANADLVITYDKNGYEPLATTFRTDEHDVAVPSWADNDAYFVPLLPQGGARPWLEAEPSADDGVGMMAIWVLANGDYGRGGGAATFASHEDPGVAQGEAVGVEIDDADGHRVAELETRRDRPLFVWLPEGSYAVRFAHATGDLQPVGVQEQFMIAGLPSAFDTIEVPVRAGRLAYAAFEIYCPLPSDPDAFVDLPTCTLDEAAAGAEAGSP